MITRDHGHLFLVFIYQGVFCLPIYVNVILLDSFTVVKKNRAEKRQYTIYCPVACIHRTNVSRARSFFQSWLMEAGKMARPGSRDSWSLNVQYPNKKKRDSDHWLTGLLISTRRSHKWKESLSNDRENSTLSHRLPETKKNIKYC